MKANRKGQLVERLISAVAEYMGTFQRPVPMKVLSARFGKSLELVGGFPETLDELKADGTLVVVLTPSGARLVSLSSLTPAVARAK